MALLIKSLTVALCIIQSVFSHSELNIKPSNSICLESDWEIQLIDSNQTDSNKKIVLQKSEKVTDKDQSEFYFSALWMFHKQPGGGLIQHPFPTKPVAPPCSNGEPECTTSYLKLGPLTVCDMDEQISMQCGGSTSTKKILIHGSVSSIPSETHCSYTIKKYSENVCQLKVEFDTRLPQPSVVANNSVPDSLPTCSSYVSISSWQFCGVNTKQHVYLPLGKTSVSETISILVAPNNSADWKITVTQLECPPDENENCLSFQHNSASHISDILKPMREPKYDTDLLAPSGCLQYFPDSTGTFESFNYNYGLGPFMPNMQYAICFKRPASASSLLFSAERFQLSYNKDQSADFEMVDQSCYDEQGFTQIHANEYLFIPYSTIWQDQIHGTRYCGSILENKNIVATPPGPFAVIVSTGSMYQPASAQTKGPRAFRLSYSIA